MSTEPTFKELLKTATLPERVVSIVMDRQLVAEFQRLEDQLATAQQKRASDTRMASEVTAAAQQIEDLREKMRASTVEFTLRGMPAWKWRDLKAKNPADEEDPSNEDRLIGADIKALFNEAVPASIVSPQIDTDDWEKFLEVLTEGEWERFVNAVYALNEEGTGVPFSRNASITLRANADE